MTETESMSNNLAVCAIDFGTSLTGIAYSFSNECNKVNILTKCTNRTYGEKIPTVVLLDKNKKFLCFGYEAQEKYSQICDEHEEKEYYYFDCFKMKLYEEKKLTADVKICDAFGREFPALDIFAFAIEHLVNYVEDMLKRQSTGYDRDDFLWVLTVPAIWSDSARHFMRKAAKKAGIPSKHLMLCLEPEAASLYCINQRMNKVATIEGNIESQHFPEGQKYLVVDLGGGTADISAHEILPDRNLREIKRADGGAFGGGLIDAAFFRLLEDIFGINVMTHIKETSYGDIMSLKASFMNKKHIFKPVPEGGSETYNIDFPVTELEKALKELECGLSFEEITNKVQTKYNGKIRIVNKKKLILDNSIMEEFFEKSVEGIVKIMSDMREDDEMGKINIAIFVGGLSSSPYIISKIEKLTHGLRIFVPNDPSIAVLYGAVLMGHKPRTITQKIARYSYGLSVVEKFLEGEHPEEFRIFQNGKFMCDKIFSKFVSKGTIYKPGDEFGDTILIYIPVDDCEKFCTLTTSVYRSEKSNPKYSDDKYGCEIGAEIIMPPPQKGWPEKTVFVPKMVLGLSELTVNVKGLNNETYIAKLEFL